MGPGGQDYIEQPSRGSPPLPGILVRPLAAAHMPTNAHKWSRGMKARRPPTTNRDAESRRLAHSAVARRKRSVLPTVPAERSGAGPYRSPLAVVEATDETASRRIEQRPVPGSEGPPFTSLGSEAAMRARSSPTPSGNLAGQGAEASVAVPSEPAALSDQAPETDEVPSFVELGSDKVGKLQVERLWRLSRERQKAKTSTGSLGSSSTVHAPVQPGHRSCGY